MNSVDDLRMTIDVNRVRGVEIFEIQNRTCTPSNNNFDGASERPGKRVDRWNMEINTLDAVALLRRLIDLKGYAMKISEIEKWFYFGSTFAKGAIYSINKDFSWVYLSDP